VNLISTQSWPRAQSESLQYPSWKTCELNKKMYTREGCLDLLAHSLLVLADCNGPEWRDCRRRSCYSGRRVTLFLDSRQPALSVVTESTFRVKRVRPEKVTHKVTLNVNPREYQRQKTVANTLTRDQSFEIFLKRNFSKSSNL
jgi:hypothetical protein